MRSALPLACKNYEFLIMNCPDGVVERDARPPIIDSEPIKVMALTSNERSE